jgi:catechol 2,3-dioxygenase-like lactoylglutathione lyase family enzyme
LLSVYSARAVVYSLEYIADSGAGGGVMQVHFDMIGIFVNNLEAMVRFYRDVVGIPINWNGEGPYAEFDHEGIRFSMYSRRKLPELLGTEPDYPRGLNGTFELAINVGPREKVDDKFEEIVEKGGFVVYPPRDEPWKMRSAMVADPEGNMIEIASDFWE